MSKLTPAEQTKMFGVTMEQLEAQKKHGIEACGTLPMLLMSMLSDVQELIAVGKGEWARQRINCVKRFLQDEHDAARLTQREEPATRARPGA